MLNCEKIWYKRNFCYSCFANKFHFLWQLIFKGEVEQKSPSADLHIVEPDHISIEIDPFRSWVVVVGKQ